MFVVKHSHRQWWEKQETPISTSRSSSQGIKIECKDFRDYNNIKGALFYEDIPYKGTTKYKVDSFPYDEFYDWCRKMSKDNIILISEYEMPDDFTCIWEKNLKCTLDKNSRTDRIERLFTI